MRSPGSSLPSSNLIWAASPAYALGVYQACEYAK
jgi:hypothetical protein